MEETGLIQIYTGDGKGKSTAAFGLALRAAGNELHCAIVQFMKEGEWYGESKAIKSLPNIEMYSYGISGFLQKETPPDERSVKLAAEAMEKATALMKDENIDIVILDELANAVYFQLVKEADVLKLMSGKSAKQELVITGRNATPAMIEMADLVTEMKEIKHPYTKGIKARRGIEF